MSTEQLKMIIDALGAAGTNTMWVVIIWLSVNFLEFIIGIILGLYVISKSFLLLMHLIGHSKFNKRIRKIVNAGDYLSKIEEDRICQILEEHGAGIAKPKHWDYYP